MAKTRQKINAREKIDRNALAIQMIEAGLRNQAIILATGLARPVIRALREEFGFVNEPESTGQFKQPHRIVTNRRRVMQCSTFMAVYERTAEDPRNSIDFIALMKAYELYRECETYPFPNGGGEALNINECFPFARDYRTSADKVSLVHCNECTGSYVVVAEQRIAANCPWCSLQKNRPDPDD